MIKRILPFLLLALPLQAAERITLLITVTNVPVTGNTLTINSDIRTWTNAHTASTILTNLVSTNHATTNLFQQIAQYPYSGGIVQQWASSNAFRLIGNFGGALSGLQTGNWASLTLSTQSGASTFTAIWPMENMVGPTNRTNQGSSLVYGLSTYSTQAFATNSTAVSNLLQKGAGPRQHVASIVQFNGETYISLGTATNLGLINATNSGYIAALTNGLITNVVLLSPRMTNGSNFGTAFSSDGPYPNSQQFAGGAVSAGGAMAIGIGATAGTNGVSVGGLAGAGHYSIAMGNGADASGATNSVALGHNSSVALASNAVALGKDTQIGDRHHNSIAIGYAAASTTNDQVVLGASTHTVIIPGMIAAGTLTNSVLRGTNTLNGRLDLVPRSNTGLANGMNDSSVLILGTNTYVRFSGPTGAYTNAGFLAEVDGSFHVLQFANPVNNITFMNESGLDTAANRILTGTGADINFTNNPVILPVIYDGSITRWRIISWTR